jgi:hypothetical protein
MVLDEIVARYLREWRVLARAEMRSFAKEDSLAGAIRRAALCLRPDGKKHSHQCLIPQPVLEEAEKRLQAAAKRLSRASDFAALHRLVEEEIGGISGIGELTVYDVAHRVGAYLGIIPALVYLHRGTKAGAAILGFRGKTLHPNDLPTAFSRLTAAEIEDCLCIYRHELRETPGRGVRSCCTARRACR